MSSIIEKRKSGWLWFGACLMLLTMLGGHELWTQEHRWADIVSGMFYRHDYLHPYLNSVDYYDKPLLSYWLIVVVAKISGVLTPWVLRLPSALAGIFTCYATYRIGAHLRNERFGLIAGWLLLTTYYFVFWARVSSADMLNVVGIMSAFVWYVHYREQFNFSRYAGFFLILALASLCKGLVAVCIVGLAILPDLIMKNRWKTHFNWQWPVAAIPALIIYILPFELSSILDTGNYHASGLYEVYRENVVRYFQPFDHQGPWYTYFLFLPIYLLPWTIFFIPALISSIRKWRVLPYETKWLLLAVGLIFLFFTASGSRRNYYILPLVPFAILLTAAWLEEGYTKFTKCYRLAEMGIIAFFGIWFFLFSILQPLYYTDGGSSVFAATLEPQIEKIRPLSQWSILLLDAPSKERFYLKLPPTVSNCAIKGVNRLAQTKESLVHQCAMLNNPSNNFLIISRKQYLPQLQALFPLYRVVALPPTWTEKLFHYQNKNAPIAIFIDRK